jgi:hypothetical protein
VWQPRLRRPEGLVTLDLRALATELEDAAADVWRVALQRRDGVDGYVVELGGSLTERQQEQVRDRVTRATGISVSSLMVSADADQVANRIRVLGSPFVDNR